MLSKRFAIIGTEKVDGIFSTREEILSLSEEEVRNKIRRRVAELNKNQTYEVILNGDFYLELYLIKNLYCNVVPFSIINNNQTISMLEVTQTQKYWAMVTRDRGW